MMVAFQIHLKDERFYKYLILFTVKLLCDLLHGVFNYAILSRIEFTILDVLI